MRRRTLIKNTEEFYSYPLINGKVGEAVFFDSNNKALVTMTQSEITSAVDGYIPIGIVVVPAEHNVYGDGTCGVMSLNFMSTETPDTGSSMYQYVCWGGEEVDTSLTNYTHYNSLGNSAPPSSTIIEARDDYNGVLPTDTQHTDCTGVLSLDGVTYYNINQFYSTQQEYFIPSPFNADGSRNEAYYTTAYSTANALSDFDGVGNTKVLTELATKQSDWKTASTITNSGSEGYYPAACCAWRYHTKGTNQGSWYLPSMGEMGYMSHQILEFNWLRETIFDKYSLGSYDSINDDSMYYNITYISSTEYNMRAVQGLMLNQNFLFTSSKSDTELCVAFIRL